MDKETEIIVLDIMKRIRIACYSHEWSKVKELCLDLKEYSKELNQLDREKLVYYNRQAQEKEGVQ